VVLIDEAYIDFGGESCLPLVGKYENLLVCQTFSKFRSLAGGRLGYALASPGLIQDLDKIKYSTNSYNINRLTMAAATATLNRDDYCAANSKTMAYCTALNGKNSKNIHLQEGDVIIVPPYETMVRIDGNVKRPMYYETKDGETLADVLAFAGGFSGNAYTEAVRHWDRPEISDWLRVTIGAREQMDIFLAKVREILKEAD